MVWYDSDPRNGGGITKYEGSKWDRDGTTFKSFAAAKRASEKRIRREIRRLQAELARVEEMGASDCELVWNPFA